MSTPLRVVFLGSDAIALPLLEALGAVTDPVGQGSDAARVVGVFTQPDRAVGRGQKVQPNAIKAWAAQRGLPVLQPEKVNEDARRELASLGADLGLVMAYGHILRDEFINTPRLGMLNLHTSVLPSYRGASPIQTAVASGETETGVTLMRIVRRLDAGPIAGIERVPVAPLDTALDVEAKLAQACVPLVVRALPRLADGTLDFVPQDDGAATYCRKLTREDGVLDFAAPARVLAARINGLFPWPACGIELDGHWVKVGLADVAEVESPSSTIAAGTILGTDADGLLVATGVGVLRLRRLQRAGGRMLPTPDFLRGFTIPSSARIPSQPMPPLVSVR